MSEEARALLEGTLHYEKSSSVSVYISVLLVLAAIGAAAIKTRRSATRSEKVIGALTVLTLVAATAAYGIHLKLYCDAITSDLADGTFIYYEGTITHDSYQKNAFYHNIRIVTDDGHDYLLRYPDYGNAFHLRRDFHPLPVGTYTGTLVYGQHSRVVVEWHTQEDTP